MYVCMYICVCTHTYVTSIVLFLLFYNSLFFPQHYTLDNFTSPIELPCALNGCIVSGMWTYYTLFIYIDGHLSSYQHFFFAFFQMQAILWSFCYCYRMGFQKCDESECTKGGILMTQKHWFVPQSAGEDPFPHILTYIGIHYYLISILNTVFFFFFFLLFGCAVWHVAS